MHKDLQVIFIVVTFASELRYKENIRREHKKESIKVMAITRETLFTEMVDDIIPAISISQVFTDFLSLVEGWKVKCKNLVWSAPKLDTHKKLRLLYEELDKFSDSVAEGYMGILGQMQPNAIKCSCSNALNALDLISEIKSGLEAFCKKIPDDTCTYKGMLGVCGQFGHMLNRINYLLHLCEVRPY